MGPKEAHLRGYINRGRGATRPFKQLPRCAAVLPLLRAQALGRLRGPSSSDLDASSRTCGYLGGAASAAQRRAAREEVLAIALPASICTTPTHFRSSASVRLVVIP